MSESKNIRVRFAPSPTGFLHIGNARTAVLNWLFAKKHDGTFVLRIEDTDIERSTRESETKILEILKWLGLDWDEGPDTNGEFAPYRQSERLDIYQKYAKKLVDSGKAFYCYCTQEELDAEREKAVKEGRDATYSGRCYHLTEEEKKAFEADGRKPTIRFRVPKDETVGFDDIVKGSLKFDSNVISDFVILRSEGIPTYNFAVVIDDYLMEISHVIRGDDHVSNTPKQVLLYEALDAELPAFAHIPMILGSDRTRLSKRHGATSVEQYRDMGFLPEAMINFLSLLGWSSPSGEELLSIDRLIDEIELERINKSAAIFDVEKFKWMNGQYIRSADIDRLTELAIPYLNDAGYPTDDYEITKQVVDATRKYLDHISQITDHVEVFFGEEVKFENDEAEELASKEESKQVYQAFLEELENYEELDGEAFKSIMKSIKKKTGAKGKNLWMPVRVGLTGEMHGPDLTLVVKILGGEGCKKRLKSVLD